MRRGEVVILVASLGYKSDKISTLDDILSDVILMKFLRGGKGESKIGIIYIIIYQQANSSPYIPVIHNFFFCLLPV